MSRYIGPDEIKAWIGIDDTDDDARLRAVHVAVESQVDAWCGRTFDPIEADATASVRYFTARESDRLVVDDFCTDAQGVDGDTSFTIEVDYSGTGSDWTELDPAYIRLRPQNARRGGRIVPWDQIRLTGALWFPKGVEDGVRITTRCWGWPGVPGNVIEAVKLQTHKLWMRRNSPDGTLGFDGGGIVVRVSDKLDKDAQALLMVDRRVVVR